MVQCAKKISSTKRCKRMVKGHRYCYQHQGQKGGVKSKANDNDIWSLKTREALKKKQKRKEKQRPQKHIRKHKKLKRQQQELRLKMFLSTN